ncbi:MAG TPA: hypothetical protein VII91_05765 [Bauldia sp.]
MQQSSKRRDRLIGLFAAGVVLLNPPVLDLFSGGVIFGWPALYVYVFCAWGLIIGGLAAVLERGREVSRGDGGDSPQ